MFEKRGYMLDISRDKVPTMATLRRIVDLLKICNYNQFQLYTEHTFSYSKHETVWREASPITPSAFFTVEGEKVGNSYVGILVTFSFPFLFK